MNAFIETLNRWGGDFCSFAWPMYWQSSLLILLLLGLEWTLRNRLRASVRYALWLVLLVKLCVPPTLALPTSPAWWIHPTPPPAVQPAPLNYAVTYDSDPLPRPSPALLPVLPAPKLTLSALGWLFAAAVISSAALLGWLLVRWWQVAQQVRRAETSERLTDLANAAQKTLGMRFKVNARVTVNSMSPAVCGLYRPAILIPRALVEHFSDEQLRAVLLHELIHLRRRDVWVNFLQALLQIGYWWHPLVWVANARIRRVREEAVDDSVMLALHDDAEAYAPTLLEVAKLALNRPLASLGLVGILESRRALRQRIERLVDFQAPRRAGMTLVSFIGIFAFTAVAVPMGQGPVKEDEATDKIAVLVAPEQNADTNQNVLVEAEFYRAGQDNQKSTVWNFDRAEYDTKDGSMVGIVASNHLDELKAQIKSQGLKLFMRPRLLTKSGEPAVFSVGDGTNRTDLECLPVVKERTIDLSYEAKSARFVMRNGAVKLTGGFYKMQGHAELADGGGMLATMVDTNDPDRGKVLAMFRVQLVTNGAPIHTGMRLQSILHRAGDTNDMPVQPGQGMEGAKGTASESVPDTKSKYSVDIQQEIIKRLLGTRISVDYDHMPLSSVLQDLTIRMAAQDPDKLGVNFIELPGLEKEKISITLRLKDVSVGDVVNAMVVNSELAGLVYSIQDDGVEFSIRSESHSSLYVRTFELDPSVFVPELQRKLGVGAISTSGTNHSKMVTALASNYFSGLGINFETPPGKVLVFNDRSGILLVRASEDDMHLIDKALRDFHPRPQIHIKARFVELPLLASGYTGSYTNNATAGMIGILTSKQTSDLLHALRSQSAKSLAEPEVVMLSGRQAQLRATEIVTIVTNMSLHVTGTNLAVSPDTRQLETGPVLDVVPQLFDDGFTIDLRTIATVTDFLGYDEVPTNTPPRYIKQYDVTLATILPAYYIRQGVAHARVWDGQTIILGKIAKHFYDGGKEVPTEPDYFVKTKKARHQPDEVDREVLVLITVNLVDAAGNLVHSDADMPFAMNGVPPQDN